MHGWFDRTDDLDSSRQALPVATISLCRDDESRSPCRHDCPMDSFQRSHADLAATGTRLSGSLVLNGVLALALGVITLVWPAITLWVLAVAFGVYALIRGITIISAAVRNQGPHRVIALFVGLIDIAAGIIALVWPAITILSLAIIIGAWALVIGVVDFVEALMVRRRVGRSSGMAWTIFGSVISVIAGLLLLWRPVAGAFGIALLIGLYSLVWAGMMFGLAWLQHRVEHAAPRMHNTAAA
jgi:uncharacterized membrane protein HdeD (DUF308 family)